MTGSKEFAMTVIATTYCGGEERESKKEVIEYEEEYEKKRITKTERERQREGGRERERLRWYDLSWF